MYLKGYELNKQKSGLVFILYFLAEIARNKLEATLQYTHPVYNVDFLTAITVLDLK